MVKAKGWAIVKDSQVQFTEDMPQGALAVVALAVVALALAVTALQLQREDHHKQA